MAASSAAPHTKVLITDRLRWRRRLYIVMARLVPISAKLRLGTACFSPPPCGEGSGGGVGRAWHLCPTPPHPPPPPSPTTAGGATTPPSPPAPGPPAPPP